MSLILFDCFDKSDHAETPQIEYAISRTAKNKMK